MTGSASTGLVFDVKRFALHDGHGIRTTAFLKGCPLRCPWCQNPEGISPERQVWYDHHRCIRCGACARECPEAVAFDATAEVPVAINRDALTAVPGDECPERLVRVCPTGALHWDSNGYSVKELVDLLARDGVFYETSGGGITLSGGEPLHQTDFAVAVLADARERGLHTALETTLYVAPAILERVIPLVDLFLVDLKIWDSNRHREIVGVGNDRIKNNIQMLSGRGVDTVIRMPLIPGMTTDHENIAAIAAFVAAQPGDVPFELINFNPLASGKYRMLRQEYLFASYTSPYSEEEYQHYVQIARSTGARVIGSA